MLLLNREEAATYAFMLSRVYLQLDINHQVSLKEHSGSPDRWILKFFFRISPGLLTNYNMVPGSHNLYLFTKFKNAVNVCEKCNICTRQDV
jgi:hypothetical protein